MLQGLIFDLDGVVVDSHPVHKRAWREFFRSLGKEVSDVELNFVLEGQKREDILRHFLGNLSDEQLQNYGARKNAFFHNRISRVKTVRGLSKLLEEIEAAGLPVAVASSARRSRVNQILRQLKLDTLFQAVLTGDDVDHGKPDPCIFLLAARSIGVPPAGILVCEDGVSGVQAAKTAGMKCLAIAANGRAPQLENAGADRVVPDFSRVRLRNLRAMFV